MYYNECEKCGAHLDREKNATVRRRKMKKATFYKLNAASWIILLLLMAEKLSFENATPVQFVLIMAMVALVAYLAYKSMMLLKKDK